MKLGMVSNLLLRWEEEDGLLVRPLGVALEVLVPAEQVSAPKSSSAFVLVSSAVLVPGHPGLGPQGQNSGSQSSSAKSGVQRARLQ